MSHCQCHGIRKQFGLKQARKGLARYHEEGLSETTQQLVKALTAKPIDGFTVLDIGGGIGGIQHELLRAGASHATSVEASHAYLTVAKEEAAKQGLLDRITYHQGDFVDYAATLELTDIVTLDRVICCYHDMSALVTPSAQRARRLYGVVYPRDTPWTKLFVKFANLFYWFTKCPFRTFIHPTVEVEKILQQQGFTRTFYAEQGMWQIAVFSQSDRDPSPVS